MGPTAYLSVAVTVAETLTGTLAGTLAEQALWQREHRVHKTRNAFEPKQLLGQQP